MAKHLRTAIPAFGIKAGPHAAAFRAFMTGLYHCGIRSDAEREKIWDAVERYGKTIPDGVPMDLNAAAYFIERELGEHAAAAVAEVYMTIKQHGPDAIPAPDRSSMEDDAKYIDGLMYHQAENPNLYSRLNQARALEIAQKGERREQYRARTEAIMVDQSRLDELTWMAKGDPTLWWSEANKPNRDELNRLALAVDNGAEVVDGEDDLLPEEQEHADVPAPPYLDIDSDGDNPNPEGE